MSCKNYIIAACIFVMLSNTESVDEYVDEALGGVKIGGTCEYDEHCIEGAYCENRSTCRCRGRVYTLSGDGKTCHIRVKAPCKDDVTCATMTNAKCKQHKCVCKDNFVIDKKNSSNCIVSFGAYCEDHAKCATMTNAECKQHKCVCKDNFVIDKKNSSNCIVSFGAYCDDHAKCATMTNAECKQNICACKDNFVIDEKNSSNCIGKPTRPGDLCRSTKECKHSMGRAYCFNEKCVCYTDHHFMNQTGKCLESQGLNQSCKHNDECFVGENTPNALECRNEKCACREGEGRCTEPTRPGDFCRRNEDCEHTMGTAECDNSKCICTPDHRFIHKTGKCLKIQGLKQPCEYNDECFLDEKTPNALECRNGKCACKGKAPCSKASSSLHHTIFEFLLILSLGVVGMLTC